MRKSRKTLIVVFIVAVLRSFCMRVSPLSDRSRKIGWSAECR